MVGIGCGVIAEILQAEAALLLEHPVALRRRHIGFDAIIFAGLQVGTAIIAGIGQHLQRFGFENLLCRFCHRMEMACIAAVDALAGDNELVLVVHDALHIVARNGLVALAQKPCVRIGQGQLSLLTRVQSLKVGLGARAPGHQLLYSRPQLIAMASVAVTVGALLGLRCVIVFERLAVSLDLPVQVCDLFGELPARENAGLAGVAMEQGAIDRDKGSADKTELSCQKHETTVHRLQGLPVLLAEVGDRPITRLQVLEQPDQFQIAARFPLQPPRRPDLGDVAVKIKLQQVGWIIGRLPRSHDARRMPKAKLCKVERANKALDRPHRVVRPNIVLNPRRKQAALIPALAGLECPIRHGQNRTSTLEKAEYLPSLAGQIALPVTAQLPRNQNLTLKSAARNDTTLIPLSIQPTMERDDE